MLIIITIIKGLKTYLQIKQNAASDFDDDERKKKKDRANYIPQGNLATIK